MPRKPDPTAKRTKGRPKRGAAPSLDYGELDRLLVFGEVVPNDRGTSSVVYPDYRKLAERFGISRSLIADYARKHNVRKRRLAAMGKIQEKVEEKIIELRADQIALSREDELRIIDTYLMKFEEALNEGRVRFDDPNDFDKMLRLKQFLQGGADSRTEIHATLSLAAIQDRYRRMQHVVNASPSERGVPTAALVAPASVVDVPVAPGAEVAPLPATEHTQVAASPDRPADHGHG